MSVSDDVIGFLKSVVHQLVVTPDEFSAFFKATLQIPESDVPRATYTYLAACQVFGVAPGLSGKRAVNAHAYPADLQGEFAKLGIGKFSVGPTSPKLELRLADYLAGHSTAASARKAITPAKRDALRAEAFKLMQVSSRAWNRCDWSGRAPGGGGVRG